MILKGAGQVLYTLFYIYYMQLILSPTFLGLHHAPLAVPPVPPVPPILPNYQDVVQWSGNVYQSESDDYYYLDDKTDNNYDVRIGGSSVLQGDGATNYIDPGIVPTPSQTWAVTINITSLGGIDLMGVYTGSSGNYKSYVFGRIGSQFYVGFKNGGSLYGGVVSEGVVELKFKDGALKVDGVLTIDASSSQGSYPTTSGCLLARKYNATRIMYPTTILYASIYDVDTKIFEVGCQESNGDTIYNKINGNPLQINGNISDIWQLSEQQTPTNLLEGFDLWEHTDGSKIYVPLKADKTSILTDGDSPPDTGYEWQYKSEGVLSGSNGAESLDNQLDTPELRTISLLFDVNPWFNEDWTPKDIDWSSLVFDYEGKGIWFVDTVDPSNINNWLVYSTPQMGTDWNAVVDFLVPELKIIDADGTDRIDADGTYRIGTL